MMHLLQILYINMFYIMFTEQANVFYVTTSVTETLVLYVATLTCDLRATLSDASDVERLVPVFHDTYRGCVLGVAYYTVTATQSENWNSTLISQRDKTSINQPNYIFFIHYRVII